MQVQRSSRDKFYIKPDNVKILLPTYPFIISFSYLCILTYVIIMELSDWFKGFEKGLARLSTEQRKAFFAECGSNCVKCGTLQVYKDLYDSASGDVDLFFHNADKLPGVKCETIEKGAAYYLYFTECTCALHKKGYVSTPLLCECSRQSILYVLHTLWNNKTFSVTLCGSILQGEQNCKIKIEVKEQV